MASTKIEELVQELFYSTSEIVRLEPNSYYWSSNEERSFKDELKYALNLIEDIEDLTNDPNYSESLNFYTGNISSDKFKTLVNESKNSLDSWQIVLNALDKAKKDFGDIQESLRIYEYFKDLKELNEDQEESLEKHRRIYEEGRDKILFELKQELSYLPSIDLDKIEEAIKPCTYEDLYTYDRIIS